MKKSKIILAATGLLTLGGLTSCGANSRDVRPQYSVVFANCYTKDRTDARLETPANARVFPNWAYPDPYDFEDPSDAIFQDGILGYVGNGDKTNIGNYTVTGNTIYRQLGKDVDFTITLDDFVVLNPIDGELVEDPTSPIGYKVNNPEYFKIYVSSDDDYYYSYNKLREDKEYTLDDSTPGVYKFHIPGEYVKFSYKVFFSASYIDATDLGFNGFDTLPYSSYPGETKRTKQTEFEKTVISSKAHAANENAYGKKIRASECYNITNTAVGGDLSCIITPTNMGGGFTFTEDYLDKLEFWGVNVSTKLEPDFTNITQYVNKNLVHYYGKVSNIIKYNGYDERKGGLTELIHTTSRTFPTNQYCCRVTFPWINSENAKGGLFTYKDGKYTLNYQNIGVTVKDSCVNDKLPTYLEKAELIKKFKVNTTAESGIEKATCDYVIVGSKNPLTGEPINVPVLEIKLTAKENWLIDGTLCCDLIKVTSKQSSDSYKYFKDLVIDDEEDAQAAFTGSEDGYWTEDYVKYVFDYNNVDIEDVFHTFNYSTEDGGKTATIRVNLDYLLRRIAIGPLSESTCIKLDDPLQGIIPVTYEDVRGSATLDMVESIELGFHAQSTTDR